MAEGDPTVNLVLPELLSVRLDLTEWPKARDLREAKADPVAFKIRRGNEVIEREITFGEKGAGPGLTARFEGR